MRIDVHAHYWPTSYLDMLERFGNKATGLGRSLPASDQQVHMDARFRMMDEAKVDLQVLSASPFLPYFEQRDHAVEAAHFINDAYAGIVQRYPQRFKAFAATPLPHIDASLEELHRCMDELGMVGVTVTMNILGKSLADAQFEPFFAELDRRGAMLLLHPSGMGLGALDNGFGLTWIIGAPFEDTSVALQLMLSGFITRHPNIKIIIPHLGGTLPFLMTRIDHQAEEFEVGKLQEKPSVLARKLWYDTVSHGNIPALYCARAIFGADRLVLGSDYPFQVDEWYKSSVSYIEEAQLPRDEARDILDGTASRLLGL